MASNFKLIIAMLVLGCVSACAATATPRPSALAPAVNIKAGGRAQVNAGETLYSFARRNNVFMRELIDLNRLQAPYEMSAGTILALPSKTGDLPAVELGPVAYENENSYREKHQAAPVTTYTQVAPVPTTETQATTLEERSYAPVINTAPSQLQHDARTQFEPQPATMAVRGNEKTVATGLNLQPLHFDKNRQQLKQASAPKATVSISVPEKTLSKTKLTKNSKTKIDPNDSVMPEIKNASLAPPELKPIAEKKLELKKAEPQMHSRIEKTHDPVNLAWPVQGSVLSTYGPKSNGLKNDGINIGAPRGAPVMAADGGTVAYAGSDIPGYGNVVLIRHPNGLMTTYAHLDRMFVQQDIVVAKGDVVGSVGTSGGLDTPQLHFEIRRDKEALDPSKYLYR
jgi:murein DD-endopeptidase MepM/ murein hydrolase activator NlpD